MEQEIRRNKREIMKLRKGVGGERGRVRERKCVGGEAKMK